MRKFVRGGSDEAHLVPYEGEEMAERRILTDKEKQGMYTMHCLGESKEAIADRYEVAVSTVYRIIREQREEREGGNDMSSSSQIVAGDKANGRLVTCADRTRFEGTCIINGKSKKRTFTAKNARDAQQQWEKWCQTLRDEQDFMDMVERKREPLEEAKVVCGYPSDPIEEIHPVQDVKIPSDETIREAIHEAQEEFDAITTRHLEATGVPLADTSEPAYLIWAKKPEPRCYGLYLTMESALSEVDKLNEVAAFLGGDGAFEVEEVAWKG